MRAALLLAALMVLCLIAAGIVLLTEPAHVGEPSGDLIYRRGSYTLTLTEEPCMLAELKAELEDAGIPPARASIATSPGLRIPGCFARDFDGDVLTRDLTGQEGFIPFAWLTRAPHT